MLTHFMTRNHEKNKAETQLKYITVGKTEMKLQIRYRSIKEAPKFLREEINLWRRKRQRVRPPSRKQPFQGWKKRGEILREQLEISMWRLLLNFWNGLDPTSRWNSHWPSTSISFTNDVVPNTLNKAYDFSRTVVPACSTVTSSL